MSEETSSFVIGTYTTAGMAIGLVSTIIICAAYCHNDSRMGKSLRFLKLLTIYNIGMSVFFTLQSYHLYTFLSTQDAFSGVGVQTDASVRKWLWIHIGAQVSHFFDVCYMIARGGNERVSYASCFHIATIYGIWGLCVDNREAVFGHGTIVFITMMMSLQAIAIYTYRIFATWGKCVTPGSQISTGFQITIFSLLAIHGGYAVYHAVDEGSVARGVCSGLWLLYSIIMTVLIMDLMFKQRSTRCCSNSSGSNPRVALPINNDPV